MSTILIKKNQGLKKPLITREFPTNQSITWLWFEINNEEIDSSRFMINEGEDI